MTALYSGILSLLFTAYFDESDTHGPAPNLILAAFIGNTRQWQLLNRKLRVLQRKYNFRVFHATEFRARTGEFHGWHQTTREQLVNELTVAISDGLTDAVMISLPRALYEAEYRAPPVPKGMSLDSQYGVCFRLLLYMFIQRLQSTNKFHKLNTVLELGHKNVHNAETIFNEVKAAHEENGSRILGTITIAKKSERPELMVADFQAHAFYLSEERVKMGLPGLFDMAQVELPKRREAGLTMMSVEPETLRGLKTAWEEHKQMRMAKWRAKHHQ